MNFTIPTALVFFSAWCYMGELRKFTHLCQ